MRIAFCDDSELDRDIIHEMLTYSVSQAQLHAEMIPYDSGINLIDDIQDGMDFDIVFLDIYMKDHLGIDVARRLRQLGYTGEIVFLTASPDFAIDGYDVAAAGYLLKPISLEKLNSTIDRVARNVDEQTYAVRQRSRVLRIPLRDILYVESSNSRCVLHRVDGTGYTIYKKLDEIQEELGDKRFLRCSQSYLVNMDHIRQADKEFVLTSGDVVMIRQRNLKAIRQTYLDYVAEKKSSLQTPVKG